MNKLILYAICSGMLPWYALGAFSNQQPLKALSTSLIALGSLTTVSYTSYTHATVSRIPIWHSLQFILYPETFLYIGVFFPLSKGNPYVSLYLCNAPLMSTSAAILNSILATLNVRKKLSYILPSAKVRMLEKALDSPPDESLSSLIILLYPSNVSLTFFLRPHHQAHSIRKLMEARPMADSWAFVSSFVNV